MAISSDDPTGKGADAVDTPSEPFDPAKAETKESKTTANDAKEISLPFGDLTKEPEATKAAADKNDKDVGADNSVAESTTPVDPLANRSTETATDRSASSSAAPRGGVQGDFCGNSHRVDRTGFAEEFHK